MPELLVAKTGNDCIAADDSSLLNWALSDLQQVVSHFELGHFEECADSRVGGLVQIPGNLLPSNGRDVSTWPARTLISADLDVGILAQQITARGLPAHVALKALILACSACSTPARPASAWSR